MLLRFDDDADEVKLDETSAVIQKYEDEKNSKTQVSLRKFVANSLVRLLNELTRVDAKGWFGFVHIASMSPMKHINLSTFRHKKTRLFVSPGTKMSVLKFSLFIFRY